MSSTTGPGPGAGLASGFPTGATQRDGEANFRAKATDTISDLGGAAKQAADTLVSAATEKLNDIANQQVAAGADLVGQVGASVRAAGQHLQPNAPYLATFVFSAAQSIEQSAEKLRGQSAEELARSTAEFARQRPEIVLGVAAVAGFLLFRLLNAGISGVTGQPSYCSDDIYRRRELQPASNPSLSAASR